MSIRTDLGQSIKMFRVLPLNARCARISSHFQNVLPCLQVAAWWLSAVQPHSLDRKLLGITLTSRCSAICKENFERGGKRWLFPFPSRKFSCKQYHDLRVIPKGFLSLEHLLGCQELLLNALARLSEKWGGGI